VPPRVQLLQGLRAALLRVADPAKAPVMQAYMKSTMPYHGVPVPLMRAVCKQQFAQLDFSSSRLWRGNVLELWRQAEFREERYCALNLAAHRRAQDLHTPGVLSMYQEIIVSGAWWDYVDDCARQVGAMLQRWPQQIRPKMLQWSRSADMWKRRTSIICQLHFKQHTDLKLLYACIEPSLDSKEFFLRKAIGWALRQYAWTDPKEVKRYVRRCQARLSPLSQREALKNIS
jgi:3-methyladenine DNA glycosylase AlkD